MFVRKNIRRILAYLIDIIIVSLLVNCLTNISFINWQLDSYNKNYKEYKNIYNEYIEFRGDLSEYYEDNKLTKKEYDKLTKDNVSFKNVVNKYYSADKLSKNNYDKLVKEVDKNFQKQYKQLFYDINRYSIFYNICYILIVLGYFVVVNIITKGRSIGKIVCGLRIVCNDSESIVLSWVNYLIRAVILYNPVYYLILIIGTFIFDVNNFYTLALILSNLNNYLLMIIAVMILVRKDGRGLHEILSNTKVVLVNKNGEEILEDDEIDNTKEVEVIRDNNISSKKSRKSKAKKIIIDSEDKEN